MCLMLFCVCPCMGLYKFSLYVFGGFPTQVFELRKDCVVQVILHITVDNSCVCNSIPTLSLWWQRGRFGLRSVRLPYGKRGKSLCLFDYNNNRDWHSVSKKNSGKNIKHCFGMMTGRFLQSQIQFLYSTAVNLDAI